MNEGSRIVITGGSGFVGSRLVEVFGSLRKETLSLDTVQGVGEISGKAGTISRRVDIGKNLPEFPDFKKCILIHAAAKMKGSPETLWSVNVEGTRNVLEWAVRHEVSHFVFMSTGGVYGYHESERKETDPISPIGIYGHTKWIGEQLCGMYSSEYGLPISVVRLYFPFGPFQRDGIFRFVFEAIQKGTALTVHEGGSPRFKPVHVDDIATACEAIIFSADSMSLYRVYNLCGDEALSFLDIVRIFEKRLSRNAVIVHSYKSEGDLLADNTRLKEIGWRPTHSIRELDQLPLCV